MDREVQRKIRSLALALLTSEMGVDEKFYAELCELMAIAGNCQDIMPNVDATDGYFYLPEGLQG